VTSTPSAPPAPPSVHIESWFRNEPQGMCRSRKAARLRLKHVGWLVAYEIYRPSEKGKPVSPELYYLQPRDDALIVGDGACGVHWRFDETSAVIRLATLDLAGRLSEWSAEVPLEPPWPMGEMPTAFSMAANVNQVENRRGCGCYLQGSSRKRNLQDVFAGLSLGVAACVARLKRRRQSCPTHNWTSDVRSARKLVVKRWTEQPWRDDSGNFRPQWHSREFDEEIVAPGGRHIARCVSISGRSLCGRQHSAPIDRPCTSPSEGAPYPRHVGSTANVAGSRARRTP
jgi:hypothetical protein